MTPNVLLIILDGVRAQNTSLGTSQSGQNRFLSSLADEAIVYKQAYAPSNWSLPSHASIFTGYEVPEHGITSQYDSLRPGHSIWAHLRDKWGYSTALFSQNEFLISDEFGLADGFDTVVGPVPAREYPYDEAYTPPRSDRNISVIDFIRGGIQSGQPVYSLVNYALTRVQDAGYRMESVLSGLVGSPICPVYRSPANVHAREFLRWHQDQSDQWAACLNFMDANLLHLPWPTPQDGSSSLQRQIIHQLDDLRWDFHTGQEPWWKLKALEPRYDLGIKCATSAVEEVISGLKKSGSYDNTLVIVTSDHGDGLGERSRVRQGFRIATHAAGIHQCLVHVPLLVSPPRRSGPDIEMTPVSLTEFPAVIKRAVKHPDASVSFRSDGPVVTAAYHDRLYDYVVSNDDWRIGEYIDDMDMSKLTGTAHAVVAADESKILKHIKWGNNSVTVRVDDERLTVREDEEAAPVIQNTFSRFEDQGIQINEDPEKIEKETINHLRQLGYTESGPRTG